MKPEFKTRINCKWALRKFWYFIRQVYSLKTGRKRLDFCHFSPYVIWTTCSKCFFPLQKWHSYYWRMISTFFRPRIIRSVFVCSLGFLLHSRSLFPGWNTFEKPQNECSLQRISVWGHLHFFKNISYLWSRFLSTYQSLYYHWIYLSSF